MATVVLNINDVLTSISNSACILSTTLMLPTKKDGLRNLYIMDCTRFNYDQIENLGVYIF